MGSKFHPAVQRHREIVRSLCHIDPLEEGNGARQSSCPGKSMDRGTWQGYSPKGGKQSNKYERVPTHTWNVLLNTK